MQKAAPGKNQKKSWRAIVRLRDMQAAASIGLLLMSVNMQPALAQQTNPTAPAPPQTVVNDTTGQAGLPQAPQPKLTEPLYLRDTSHDYSQPKSHFWNPIAPYTATDVPLPRLGNTPNLDSLLKDGKIYLSLSDAVTLALENNYDIAIARINLDIADTDILRAKAGSTLRGAPAGLVTNTLGGTSTTVTSSGGRRVRVEPLRQRAAPAREHRVWC